MAQRASLGLFLLFVGCFPSGEGVDPPVDRSVYFPVGLALDTDARHLIIANSNFDLQYNAGTLESWDLDALRSRIPVTCASDAECTDGDVCDTSREDNHVPSGWCVPTTGSKAGSPCRFSRELSAAERQLFPGRCAAIDPRANAGGLGVIRRDRVEIGSFATDVIFRARPATALAGQPGRVFIPVRGDATLHWVEVRDDGSLECGQDTHGACSDAYRRGNNAAAENTRGLSLLPEPYGVDANETGEWLMVTNQTSEAVGLFKNVWADGGGFANGPSYQYTVAGLPGQPMGVASVPRSRASIALGYPDQPEFLVGFRSAAQMNLLRVYPDEGSTPPRPYAKSPDFAVVRTNSNGTDSRGMALDASVRRNAEATCAARNGVSEECADGAAGCEAPSEAYLACVQQAASLPLDVLVANRAPASLLVAQTRQVVAPLSAYDVPTFHAVIPLGFGPARVVTGDITTADGGRERRAFAISFDSRRVLVYDTARGRVEAEIVTGRGPQAMAIDSDHALGYVALFIDSYIGVVDLDQRHPATYGVIIAMIETPAPPRASK